MSEGRRLGWEAIAASDPQTKAYRSQWDTLEKRQKLLYYYW